MLFPYRQDLPPNVDPALLFDYDVFTVDAPDGDFARGMFRLRERGAPPIFWTRANLGHWVATRPDLVERIVSDSKHFSNAAMRVPRASNPTPPMAPLMLDPPDHIKYRMLLMGALSPASVRRMTADIRSWCIALIEGFKSRGSCEFVAEFSQHLPIAVFLSLIGLPSSEKAELMHITDRIVQPKTPEERMEGFATLGRYVMERVSERRAHPGNDLISSLIDAEVDGEPLDDAMLEGLLINLMLAGLDTVAGMLTYIAAFLARNPAHRRRLIQEPSLIPAAVEEFLRRMAMVNLTRLVVEDIEIGGAKMKAGDLVVAPTPLANIDDERYERPLDVDFDRPRPRHATFGAGAHVCPGASLARTELIVFLQEWLPRIPDFSIAPNAELSVRVGAAALMPSLPLIWEPAQRGGDGGAHGV